MLLRVGLVLLLVGISQGIVVELLLLAEGLAVSEVGQCLLALLSLPSLAVQLLQVLQVLLVQGHLVVVVELLDRGRFTAGVVLLGMVLLGMVLLPGGTPMMLLLIICCSK